MTEQTTTPLVFKVRRQEPELVAPAKPTPRELKPLSDIDDQEGFRFQLPIIQFYRRRANGDDPVVVIKEALAKALVFYCPFAGRLREGHGRKLVVDCTGEGVMFVEAEADVRLEDFGEDLQPPFPCLEELIFDVPGSSGVIDCPLLLIQVTRLKCGGFILGLKFNHTMCDGKGLVQFMSAIGEIARGASEPSVAPVWARELLNARDHPKVTCVHREYEEVEETKGTIIPLETMVHRSFFFGPDELLSLRRLLPPHLRGCTRFEVLAACLWHCHTVALQPDPEEEIRLIFTVNARNKFTSPLPAGYYGNAIALPAAVSIAGRVSTNPLGYVVDLIRKAKVDITEEYMKSIADLMVLRGRPQFTSVRRYLVSDLTHIGFTELDFGWGLPAYGGPAKDSVEPFPGFITFFIPYKNGKQRNGVLIPVSLTAVAMQRFAEELDGMLKNDVVYIN